MSVVAAQPISASPPIVVQKALDCQGFFVVSLQTFSPLPASRTLGEEFDHKRKADFRTPVSLANECSGGAANLCLSANCCSKSLGNPRLFCCFTPNFSPLPASRTLGEEFDHKRKADFRTPVSFANECIRKPAVLRQPTLFSASTLDVILQRLMPLYRLRQTGESMTLLPSATHIDIATAMALWILGIGTSRGVCHPSMTTRAETSFFSASCRFIG